MLTHLWRSTALTDGGGFGLVVMHLYIFVFLLPSSLSIDNNPAATRGWSCFISNDFSSAPPYTLGPLAPCNPQRWRRSSGDRRPSPAQAATLSRPPLHPGRWQGDRRAYLDPFTLLRGVGSMLLSRRMSQTRAKRSTRPLAARLRAWSTCTVTLHLWDQVSPARSLKKMRRPPMDARS